MMDARITKKAAITALLAGLDLSSELRKKLEARIAFIGRAGFPHGINTGRGFRGGYTFEQFWQLFLLLQLQQLGLPLSAALKLVHTHWGLASGPISIAFDDPTGKLGMRFYWIYLPAIGLPGDQTAAAGVIETIALKRGEALQEIELLASATHFAIIDASAVIAKAANAISEATDPELRNQLLEAHALWRTQIGTILKKASKEQK